MINLIEYIKTSQINEMSLNKSKFENNLLNIINQIIEYWCLVKWCDNNIYNQISERLRNHWAGELKGHMNSIVDVKIKSGRKDKIIKNLLINQLELNDNTEIAKRIRNKFNNEGLSKYINNISADCANHITDICNVLSGDEKDVEYYINGEIG